MAARALLLCLLTRPLSALGVASLRRFSAGDVLAQATAAAELDQVAYPPHGLWSVAQFTEELQCARTTALAAWLPRDDDSREQLVGMAFTSTVLDETSLTTLAVHPTARRQGLAEALLRECVECAQTAGSTRFILEVRASNAPAIALYEKCGFVCIGRRKKYYRDNEVSRRDSNLGAHPPRPFEAADWRFGQERRAAQRKCALCAMALRVGGVCVVLLCVASRVSNNHDCGCVCRRTRCFSTWTWRGRGKLAFESE